MRYFERVLPIMKRNICTGMNRVKKMLRKNNMMTGMNQFINLTVSLARNNPENQTPDIEQQIPVIICQKLSTASAPLIIGSGKINSRENQKLSMSGDTLLVDTCIHHHCTSEPCLSKYSARD